MDESGRLRIGDRERGDVVEALRRHAADGRLEPEELEQRLDAAFAARTQADLEPLTRDLPPLADAGAVRRAAVGSTLRPAVLKWLGVNAICFAVWLATGVGWDDFWPKWVLLGTTIALIAGAFNSHEDDEGRRRLPPEGPSLPR